MAGIRYYKFYLNNTLVEDPMDWQEMQIIFQEDEDLAGLIFQYTTPVNFVGDGYSQLLAEFEDAICQAVEVKIEEYQVGAGYVPIFYGNIFLNQVEFDYSWLMATVTIHDNSWVSKIRNNKDIKAQVDVGRSKNDVAITPAPLTSVDFFTPETGVYDQLNVQCYLADDVLRFLIDFMTDDTVTYTSTFLASSGLVFCLGAAINEPGEVIYPVYTSFAEAFMELRKKYNLVFIIENPLSATPGVKIEPYEDIYIETTSVTLTGIKKIRGFADIDKYYQKVIVGSNTTEFFDFSYQFPPVQFLAFEKEEYHMLGVCNSNKTLDLVSNFLIDSNLIENIIETSTVQYDDDIFLVETEVNTITGQRAIQYAGVIANFVYNKLLVNNEVVRRWFGSIPSSVALFLGDGNDESLALKTGNETLNILVGGATYTLEPVAMTDEITDPNNNYTAASSYYTVPSNGVYSFFSAIYYSVTVANSNAVHLLFEIVAYSDSTFVTELFVVDFQEVTHAEPEGPSEIVHLSGYKSVYLETGNTVRVRLKGNKIIIGAADTATSVVTIYDSVGGADSIFQCLATVVGGGVYQTFEEADVRRILYQSEDFPMLSTDFETIANNIGQQIAVTGTKDVTGWLKELEYNRFRKMASLTIRSKT